MRDLKYLWQITKCWRVFLLVFRSFRHRTTLEQSAMKVCLSQSCLLLCPYRQLHVSRISCMFPFNCHTFYYVVCGLGLHVFTNVRKCSLGAFLIFEKDCSYSIVQYYAKPKERLSRYSMRHSLLENDIISKLLERISVNRLGLIQYYKGVEVDTNVITRDEWAAGLKKVLKLNIPFLEFQVTINPQSVSALLGWGIIIFQNLPIQSLCYFTQHHTYILLVGLPWSPEVGGSWW